MHIFMTTGGFKQTNRITRIIKLISRLKGFKSFGGRRGSFKS